MTREPVGTGAAILRLLMAKGPMTDGDISRALGVAPQAVNQTCRALEKTGRITRRPGRGDRIVNARVDPAAGEPVNTLVRRGLRQEHGRRPS